MDSVSLVGGSFTIARTTGSIIPADEYSIDYVNAILLSKTLRGGFIINYKVFPMLFSKPFYHKSLSQYISTSKDSTRKSSFPDIYSSGNDQFEGSLQTNGTISRGISVGNNQDVILNSNLNLQMSGYLTENLKLEGSISDNNIPIQPQGNSQQIQDFDKVYIKVYNKQFQTVFGDYEISDRNGTLLKYHKKGQGIMAESTFKTAAYTETSQVAIAIAKGKTCEKIFQGTEGNQGPYKITGCDNELFIVVLSGTEKVFIDGQLKKRGEDLDYTIDYNTGEIRFTPYMPITKDTRITVDFEYSDKNYARFMVSTNNSFETLKSKTWVNIMSETDNKNQSLQQNLDDARKQTLANSGDKPAYVDGGILDSSKSSSKIYYNKRDTTVNRETFKSIYVLSSNINSVEYSVTFSYVGENSGDYSQFQSNANGNAYKWIAPNGNIHYGNYVPMIVLAAPKKKQVITMGNEYKISKNTKSYVEMAVSNNDANTFSSLDDKNNTAIALRFGLNQKILLDSNKHSLETQLSQSIIQKQFNPFDTYKPIEFDRDWNLKNQRSGNEYLSKASVKSMLSIGELGYGFDFLNRNGVAHGIKNSVNGNISKDNFHINYTASAMQSKDSTLSTVFDRYAITGSKNFKQIIVGVTSQQEYDKWDKQDGTISMLSSRFISQKAFISKADSLKWLCNVSGEIRNDFSADTLKNKFITSTKSYDYKSVFGITKNPKNSLKLLLNYRIVDPLTPGLTKQEKNMSGRIEHQLLLLHKGITANTFYQVGSGLESKKTYTYVEVTPGQGVYMWNDYNNNGKAELNEFEIAKYQYQANYIKVYNPTNDYISTFSNQFSELCAIDPKNILRNKHDGMSSFVSKFYNISNYKCTFKTTENNIERNINPFRSLKNDTSLVTVTSLITNTVYFNRSSSKFSINYNFSNENNKTLTSNGWEDVSQIKHSLNDRIEVFSGLTFYIKAEKGIKLSNIEAVFMDNKNYHIDIYNVEPKLTWQPTPYKAFDLLLGYSDLKNIASEHALKETLGAETRISGQKSWKFTLNGKFIVIKYNAASNTSLAYTMLEGLLPGNNSTWEANFQNTLGKYLRLSILYQGQKSEKTKIIQTGSIQLSAIF